MSRISTEHARDVREELFFVFQMEKLTNAKTNKEQPQGHRYFL